MNVYADLTTLKRRMGFPSSSTWDTDLLTLLNASSRMIDNYTKREFWVQEETRYFNGAGDKLLVPDILSITTIKLDEDADGTYEETMTVTQDYLLEPYAKFPKFMLVISSRSDKEYTSFANGIKYGVEIDGSWGYGNGRSATPYVDASSPLNEDLDTSETEVDVYDGTSYGAGQTILIDSEQMYIKSISSNTLTVTRGVNGTTAATHSDDADIYIYQYPDEIMEGCLMQAAEWYKLRETGYTGIISSTEFGDSVMKKGLDPTVKLMINPYRRYTFGS